MNNPYTTIIAEAGVNHNGSIARAKKLIDVAADAGADLVKFQTFKAETLVIETAEKADYQKNMTEKSESQETGTWSARSYRINGLLRAKKHTIFVHCL